MNNRYIKNGKMYLREVQPKILEKTNMRKGLDVKTNQSAGGQ